MVYVDDIRVTISRKIKALNVGKRWGHQWCHMWADSLDELLTFALSIGLKKSWLQHNRICDHFDLVPSMRKKAVDNGAKEYSFKTWLKDNRNIGKS